MNGILGIISEYNPFHNGHLYHLEQSKRITKSNYTICVMSGNFVQRGDTSLIDKWSKAEIAIKSGVDLVIELPTVYAISSAENFAEGAVKILNSLGIVDYLSFGSEIGDINSLSEIADILYNEPKEFSTILSRELSKGVSYPQARSNALLMYLGNVQKYSTILSSPNNTLGIEYLKSLKRLKSSIVPVTIKRNESDYNGTKVKNGIASATAIREMIKRKVSIHSCVPYDTYEILQDRIKYGKIVPNINVFEKEIIYTLRKMSLAEISELPDVAEGLENRLKAAANYFNNLDDLINYVKTKRYTQSRIQRILIYALLNITKKDILVSKKVTPYIRVLGFNSFGKQMISRISEYNPKLKIIISVKKFLDNCNDQNLKNMLSKDILASNVYTLGFGYEPFANLDYTHKVIEIK